MGQFPGKRKRDVEGKDSGHTLDKALEWHYHTHTLAKAKLGVRTRVQVQPSPLVRFFFFFSLLESNYVSSQMFPRLNTMQ